MIDCEAGHHRNVDGYGTLSGEGDVNQPRVDSSSEDHPSGCRRPLESVVTRGGPVHFLRRHVGPRLFLGDRV